MNLPHPLMPFPRNCPPFLAMGPNQGASPLFRLPFPVVGAAALSWHHVSTWSAEGPPRCRCTVLHCPERSCRPASFPRGWLATPGLTHRKGSLRCRMGSKKQKGLSQRERGRERHRGLRWRKGGRKGGSPGDGAGSGGGLDARLWPKANP